MRERSPSATGSRPDLAPLNPVLSAAALVLGIVVTLAANAAYSPTPVNITDIAAVAARIGEITGMDGPWFWLGFGAIFALERVVPARRDQPALPFEAVYDFGWLLVDVVVRSGLLLAWDAMLNRAYQGYLWQLTLTSLADLPYAFRLVAAFLFADLMSWVHHWTRHRVVWFWYLHALHHSQRHLNAFTDYRYHPVEYVLTSLITFLPFRIFNFGVEFAALFVVLRSWYTRLYHANIGLSFGPLRYVLITPLTHRVHHSTQPEHHHKNFGLLLCIWDRLFGTYSEGDGEFPPTGLDAGEFPIENDAEGLRRLMLPVEQALHPFRRMARDLRRTNRPG